jgi:hypothetical protein
MNGATDLRAFAKNYHSQAGEDGIIERILEVVGEGDRWCVEFGAWDGKHLSNTYHLIHRRGWSAVLIEGSLKRFWDLRSSFEANSNVVPIHRYVSFEGPDTLDAILAGTQIPHTFSILSIDIDGNDYHVWDALTTYTPRIVVIEFNPSIPNDIEFVQPRDLRVSQGSSLLSLVQLGRNKGYELVATTDWNAFFVREDLFSKFGMENNSLDRLRDDTKFQTKVFQLFDGTIMLTGCRQMLWHGATVSVDSLQAIPRPFRVYPARMGRLRSAAWSVAKRMMRRFRP